MSLGEEVQIQLVDEVTLPDIRQPVLGSSQDEGRVPPCTRDGRACKLLPVAPTATAARECQAQHEIDGFVPARCFCHLKIIAWLNQAHRRLPVSHSTVQRRLWASRCKAFLEAIAPSQSSRADLIQAYQFRRCVVTARRSFSEFRKSSVPQSAAAACERSRPAAWPGTHSLPL